MQMIVLLSERLINDCDNIIVWMHSNSCNNVHYSWECRKATLDQDHEVVMDGVLLEETEKRLSCYWKPRSRIIYSGLIRLRLWRESYLFIAVCITLTNPRFLKRRILKMNAGLFSCMLSDHLLY